VSAAVDVVSRYRQFTVTMPDDASVFCGFVHAPDGMLGAYKKVLDESGILLIADEVQTGAGRTGTWFACERWPCAPDIVVSAKSLAGGFPLSAVTGRADVMDAPAAGGLGGTYAGSPIGCAAALAVLQVFEEERLLERSLAMGERIRAGLVEIAKGVPAIRDVRGLGAMLAIELVRDPTSKEPAPDLSAAVIEAALQRGLILLKAGLAGNCIRVLCPLTIEDAVLDEALAAWEDALGAVLDG
jgi:4-aminobutyrate aminotransferase/(S)-3-amino-2-methylpropionate transaminase